MRQINVETATREQLVDFVQYIYSQLQREQERAKELGSQIAGFQDLIDEKNAEIRELRQQSDRLTEKSASDEETIGSLIKQMETMRLEQAPAPNLIRAANAAGANLIRGRSVEQGTVKGHTSGGAPGNEGLPEAMWPVDAPGNGEAGRRPSRTPPPLKDNIDGVVAQLKSQNAAAALTISGKMEEIANLENKVRELMEVNAFYSAIVAQHDEEEKARMELKLVSRNGQSEEDAAELRKKLEHLQFHVVNLDIQKEKLRRLIKATEAEKAVLRQENEVLKNAAVQLEAEMEEMTRDYARARRTLAAVASRQPSTIDVRLTYPDDDRSHGRAVSAPQQCLLHDNSTHVPFVSSIDGFNRQPERRYVSLPNAMGFRVSPLSLEGRQGVMGSGGVSPVSSTTNSIPALRARFNFRSLRPIRVRDPDAHERDLLDRIRLYEEQLSQMELFEADRQRSFDEMERNRAEMFAAMNGQLEKQRKEIHRLRKLLEDASLGSSLNAWPSFSHSVGTAVNREEEQEGQANQRRHGSHSPVERCLTAVPTNSQLLRNADLFGTADDVDGSPGASPSERDTLALYSSHHRRTAPPPPFSSSVGSALGELRRQEEEERSVVWREAIGDAVELTARFHAVIVQGFTDELAACHAKLLGEREALTADLESLQLYNKKLEARLGEVEAELHRLSVAAEDDLAAQVSVEVERPNRATDDTDDDSDSSAHLLEHKALYTVYLALEAYASVAEQYVALLRLMSENAVGDRGGNDSDDFAEDVGRDLAEVHATLDSLRRQQRKEQLLQTTQMVINPVPLISGGFSASQSLPLTHGVVAEGATAENSNNEDGAVLISSSDSSYAPAKLASHEDPKGTTADKEGPADVTAATTTPSDSREKSFRDSDHGDVEVTTPPCVFEDDTTPIGISQTNSQRISLNCDAVSCSEGQNTVASGNCTASMEADAPNEGEEKNFWQISADEADGTATSQFADCVEKDDGTGFTSAVAEGAETAPSAGTLAEEDIKEGKPEVASFVSADDIESGESNQDEDALDSLVRPEQPPHTTADESETADAERDTNANFAGRNVPVVWDDSDDSEMVNARSHLGITAREEAGFLAQLQREMGKDEAEALTAPGGEETQTVPTDAVQSFSFTATSSASPEHDSGEVVLTEVDSNHYDQSKEESIDRADKEVLFRWPTAATDGEASYDEVTALKTLETALASPPSVDDASLDGNQKKESSSFHVEKQKIEREATPETDDEEEAKNNTSPSFLTLETNHEAASPSPDACTGNHAVQDGGGVVLEMSGGFAGAQAADILGHAPVPSMIPPASLDDLFVARTNAASNQWIPAKDAPISFIGAPTPSLPPPPPSQLLSETHKPASPFATFQNVALVPTLSPNSVFVSPSQPLLSRTLFAKPPINDKHTSQFQFGETGAKQRTSSSSDDEFEADFDPFA